MFSRRSFCNVALAAREGPGLSHERVDDVPIVDPVLASAQPRHRLDNVPHSLQFGGRDEDLVRRTMDRPRIRSAFAPPEWHPSVPLR